MDLKAAQDNSIQPANLNQVPQPSSVSTKHHFMLRIFFFLLFGVIIVALGVSVYYFLFMAKTSKTPSVEETTVTVIEPSPKMAAAYGTIIEVDADKNMVEIAPDLQTIGHNWQVIIDDRTILMSSQEWFEALAKPYKLEDLGNYEIIFKGIPRKTFSDFKKGDKVDLVVEPSVNLEKNEKIGGVIALLKL